MFQTLMDEARAARPVEPPPEPERKKRKIPGA
jgi:hypothetical protein